jgi:hypothetical protein
MKNIIFILQIHSVVDLITNSSSELFVGQYDSKKIIIDLIKSIYPDYLNEYSEIKSIDELTVYELEEYISYKYAYRTKYFNMELENIIHLDNPNLIPGFTKEEMYDEPEYDYIHVRDNFVRHNHEKIINSIDPERKMFFLFSIDDNPNWDMQEKLMEIMERYHLG